MGIPTGIVTFLGDSYTAHLNTLSDWYGAAASNYVNAGVGGETSYNILARVGSAVPNTSVACVLLCGINDIGGGAGQGGTYEDVIPPGTVDNGFTSVADYIRQIVANLTGRSITPIVGTLPPVCQGWSNTIGGGVVITASVANTRIQTLNTWLKANAGTYGYTVADYYPYFVGADTYGLSNFYNTDGLHPNTVGSGILTAVAGAALAGGSTIWTRTSILRDTPATTGETIVTFRGLTGGLVLPRNWTLRVGSAGYTGTGMTDAQIDACARTQMGI